MVQFSNLNSTMETRDHSKNGASPKSLMSKGNLLCDKIKQLSKNYFLLLTLLLISLLFDSCATMMTATFPSTTIKIDGNVKDSVQLCVGGKLYTNVNFPIKVKIPVEGGEDILDTRIAAYRENYDVAKDYISNDAFNYYTLISAPILVPLIGDYASGCMFNRPDKNKIYLTFKKINTDEERIAALEKFDKELYTQKVDATKRQQIEQERFKAWQAQKQAEGEDNLVGNLANSLGNLAGAINNLNNKANSTTSSSSGATSNSGNSSSSLKNTSSKSTNPRDCAVTQRAYSENLNTIRKVQREWDNDIVWDIKNNTYSRTNMNKDVLRDVLKAINYNKKVASDNGCSIQYNTTLESWAKAKVDYRPNW